MANRTTLSERKYRQLALESLRNALRLLRDAIALYENGSFPTAFQLAVLAMEEYAKAKWRSAIFLYQRLLDQEAGNATFHDAPSSAEDVHREFLGQGIKAYEK